MRRLTVTYVLVIPRFEDLAHAYYAGEIIKGASLAASRLKIDFLIHITNRFDHRDWLNAVLLDHKNFDGIIFADIDNDVNVVKKAIKRGMPCMVLNNMLSEPFNCIAIDNERATFEIVDHLVELGHTRIATIAGDMTTQAGLVRLKAFAEGLAKHGIKLPKSYVTYGNFLRTPAREAAEKILKLKNRPTAVFVASDVMALELIDVAKRLRISIPEELSVVGFDDNPLSRTSPVPLTTVPQPLIEMARLGTENLYQICRGKAKLPVKLILPARLYQRKSTGPCPQEINEAVQTR